MMIINCIIFSLGYSIIETIYRQIKYNKTTTVGQTIITFIWTPCIIYHFDYFNLKEC